MKILFWTDGFCPRLGGIETQAFQFITEMQARGHEYIVLAQQDQPNWPETEVFKGVNVKRFNFNEIIERENLKIIKKIKQYLDWVIQVFQPDIIHLNTLVCSSAFFFSFFMKMFQVPIVLTVHAPYLHQNKLPLTIVKIMMAASQIACVSQWVLDEMQIRLPGIKNKLHLIYN